MKILFDMIAMVVGGIFAMSDKEQSRQYDYDNGNGEVEK